MIQIRPRPVLCPGGGHADLKVWTPSGTNFWWTPKTAAYPSTAEFLPGDILLFRPLTPNSRESGIVSYQRKVRGYDSEHASYTHAAIWVGLDQLYCDATPALDVRVNSLEDYLANNNSCLLVRRIPNINGGQREAIARAAVGYRGQPYSFRTIVQELWGHFMSREPFSGIDEETQRGLICSTLCSRAVLIGSETVSLLPNDLRLVIPATLSESSKLEDVSIWWCAVELA